MNYLDTNTIYNMDCVSGRRFIGFEIVPVYWEFAQKRLDANTYRI